MEGKYFYWNENELELQCIKCHKPVSRMSIQASIRVGLGDEDIEEDIFIFYCEDWEYINIRLVCSCGVEIPVTEFDWDCHGEMWGLRISKEDVIDL